MVRSLAALMAAVIASAWTLASLWSRPGKAAQHRVELSSPRLIRHGFDVALYTSLVYPILVVIAPRWTYEGWGNWSSGVDAELRAGGLILWILGVSVFLWSSRVMGRHLAIDGLAEDHELVTRGPFGHVRHPIYVSFASIAIGTALVFRSYVLLGLSAVLMVTGYWWANAEEQLLASDEGFGEAYRNYAARTGRFLPRPGRSSDGNG